MVGYVRNPEIKYPLRCQVISVALRLVQDVVILIRIRPASVVIPFLSQVGRDAAVRFFASSVTTYHCQKVYLLIMSHLRLEKEKIYLRAECSLSR